MSLIYKQTKPTTQHTRLGILNYIFILIKYQIAIIFEGLYLKIEKTKGGFFG